MTYGAPQGTLVWTLIRLAVALQALFLFFVFCVLTKTYGVCGGALWWYAIGRLVFGVSALLFLRHDAPPSCYTVRGASLIVGGALTSGALADPACRAAMSALPGPHAPLLGILCLCFLAEDAWWCAVALCFFVFSHRRQAPSRRNNNDDDDDDETVIIIDLQAE